MRLEWLPAGQFAGYYVAAARGFYKEADLDVTVKPGGPDIAPPQVLAANGADVDRRLDAQTRWPRRNQRAAGQHLADLQPVRDDADLQRGQRRRDAEDFKGKTLGVWFGGNSIRSSPGWRS